MVYDLGVYSGAKQLDYLVLFHGLADGDDVAGDEVFEMRRGLVGVLFVGETVMARVESEGV